MKYIILLLALYFYSTTITVQAQSDKQLLDTKTVSGIKFRSIGPAFMSGRIVDFAVNSELHSEYYVAVASGGVWKTKNAGTTWKPVFENEGSFSTSCVVIDPNNPHRLWVGTGENNSHRSVSYGDGVYKSEDGGESWENMGLKNSEHIGKIIVNPKNSNIVYVASQGPLWSSGGERGLYKTTNGGTSWERVLYISKNTGITDIVIDPRDPEVIYAASYQRERKVWSLVNGGPESRIYKSTDGGNNWKILKSGLPKRDIGKIGLAISPANPDYLYAVIEAEQNDGGTFRSINRGESWEKRSSKVSGSPQYYQELFCDPHNVNKFYMVEQRTTISTDGGKTFKQIGNKNRHVDDHAIWINPSNTNHLLIGGDGGIYETFDGGKIWDFKNNLPVTQFYRISLDNAEPFYNVYGGTQDNSSQAGPSRTLNEVGIVNSDWYITQTGDGFKTQIDPKDPNIIYAQSQLGNLVRYNKTSGEKIGIKPREQKGEKPYRWNWDAPLIISPHSNSRLYFASNFLFQSDNKGNSWVKISPDLSRQLDRNSFQMMGKIWSVDAVAKNRSTAMYGNIFALDESPIREGLIYTGTDDGVINITLDGGKNWSRIKKFTGIPDLALVNNLIASQHNENIVYAVFNNLKNGDFKPYILKSNDKGKNWKSISSNLPERGSVYSFAEDHVNPNLLFTGTEFGIYFTIDNGQNWIKLKGNIPTICVRDIAIQKRENDLVLGTFGRGVYILDDYSFLRNLTKKTINKECHIFPIKDASIYILQRPYGRADKATQGESLFAAENPPFGATITYYLKEQTKSLKEKRQEKEKKLLKKGQPIPFPSIKNLKIEDDEEKPFLRFVIKDDQGNIVRILNSELKTGLNRITWDIRYSSPDPISIKKNEQSGNLVLPGKYSVSVSIVKNGETISTSASQSFNAVLLNSKYMDEEDYKKLVSFQKNIRELRRIVFGTRKYLDETMNKVKHFKESVKNELSVDEEHFDRIKKLVNKLNNFNRILNGDKSLTQRFIVQSPSIKERVNQLTSELWRTTTSPTNTQISNYKITEEEFNLFIKTFKSFIKSEFTEFEKELENSSAPWTPGRFPEWDLN